MNALILSILLCQTLTIEQGKNVDNKVQPEKVCKVKGNECKEVGPDYIPFCIPDGAMKGTIRCDKLRKR
jgi:hypothetical protein